MNSKQQREQRKALLLRQIQQQRLDLIASRRDWLEATAPFDRGWLTLQHLRSWAVVAAVSWQYGPFVTRAFYCAGLNAASVSGAPGAWQNACCARHPPSKHPARHTSAIPVFLVPGRKRLVTGAALRHHSSRRRRR